ncbi:MAG: sterol desaturase family protein [Kordiimonadaceae bacterium]|nr:sterol desaturase family protein [Kordiimonadaceae bacterium]
MVDFLQYHFELWSRGLFFDFFRYLWGAGGVFLLVWVVFKKPLQGRKIRTKTPKFRQMFREFYMSMLTVAVYGLIGIIIHYGMEGGVMEMYGDPEKYGWAFYVFSFVAIVVAHDAYFYWTHRAMHSRKLIKHIHGEHHKSINPSPWTSYRFDIYEAFVNALFMPAFLLLMPLHYTVTLTFLAHMIIRNAMAHCGYELFPRSWVVHPVFSWIAHVTHHDMHHANGRSNFGFYFSFWDRVMGTEHPDYVARVTLIPGATRENYKELKAGEAVAAE